MVLDNASCHKSKAVMEYVESAGDDVELGFLPPYTPQLNPIETAWRDLKRRLAGRYFRSTDELKRAVTDDRRVRDGKQAQGIPNSLINSAKNCNSKPATTHWPSTPASRLEKLQNINNNATRGVEFCRILRQNERIAMVSTTHSTPWSW